MTYMEKDVDSESIPCLGLADGRAQSITTSAATARTATAFRDDTRIVYLWATQPAYIRFGDISVTAAATDFAIPANQLMPFTIGGGKTQVQKKYLAALQVSSAGVVYVCEAE